MAELLNQRSLIDLDVYGRSANNGGALVHTDDFAVSNAIVFFLTAKRGSYLYNPNFGGVLERLNFKLINEATLREYSSLITTSIENNFSALVSEVAVIINYDFTKNNKIIEIEIYYTSIRTEQKNLAFVYIKPKADMLEQPFVDVNLEGENLQTFVVLNVQNVNAPLTYNQQIEVYTWGKYKLNKLQPGSEYFEYIKNLLGFVS